jgi:multicomponent Na+:H+ antiporter subunit D
MRLAMVILSALCIGFGLMPGGLYAMLPFKVDFVPYTASHVVFQLQLLLFSGLAFFLMLGWLRRTLTITLDTDWLYRKLGLRLARDLGLIGQSSRIWLSRKATRAIATTASRLEQTDGFRGQLARSMPTGSMAIWAIVVLTVLLILSYL